MPNVRLAAVQSPRSQRTSVTHGTASAIAEIFWVSGSDINNPLRPRLKLVFCIKPLYVSPLTQPFEIKILIVSSGTRISTPSVVRRHISAPPKPVGILTNEYLIYLVACSWPTLPLQPQSLLLNRRTYPNYTMLTETNYGMLSCSSKSQALYFPLLGQLPRHVPKIRH